MLNSNSETYLLKQGVHLCACIYQVPGARAIAFTRIEHVYCYMSTGVN